MLSPGSSWSNCDSMAPRKIERGPGVRRGMPSLYIQYLETLRVTQGRLAGQPLTVLPWQKRFIHKAFGSPGDAALSVARGNGKTTLVAGLAAASVDGPMRLPRAEVIVVASSFAQARLTFDHLKHFLGEKIRDRREWRLVDNFQHCRLEHRASGATVRCLGSDPKRMHGLAPKLVICDEPAQWPNHTSEAALAALRTSMGKIPDSRLIALGTRAATADHWFSRMLKGDKAVMYSARPDDPPFQRRTWKRANPSLDIMPDLLERLRIEAAEAWRDPVALASFEALRLNKGTSDVVESLLLDARTWKQAVGQAEQSGGYILGLDLGSVMSMSAAAGYWPDTGRLDGIGCFAEQPDLGTRGLRDGVGGLYKVLHERDELVIGGVKVHDPRSLLDEVWTRWGKPAAVVCDRWRILELREALRSLRWPVVQLVERGQGYKDGGEDVRTFRRAFLEGKVTPTASLLLAAAVSEARTISDPAGNSKLANQRQGKRSGGRDDAAAAAILAVSLGHRKRSKIGSGQPAFRSSVVG